MTYTLGNTLVIPRKVSFSTTTVDNLVEKVCLTDFNEQYSNCEQTNFPILADGMKKLYALTLLHTP